MQMRAVRAIIVGAGHRAQVYAKYADIAPDQLQIVGVADPDPARRRQLADRFGFSEEMCFESAEALAAIPKCADAIINGTMDDQHVKTSIPLIRAGYDILLEKPMAINEDEMFLLYNEAKAYGSKIMICHVLRYAGFYKRIKELLLDGTIGDVISIAATEHVNFHHTAVSYVRGKWGNKKESKSSMLLAKCSHDIDMLVWLMGGAPAKVSSFGSDFQFDEKKKPVGAGKRCLVDCKIEPYCRYSAKKHYIESNAKRSYYVWGDMDTRDQMTTEDMILSLQTDNIHGRCVWDCNHDNVDHQTVMLQFEDGANATLQMVGGAARAERSIHIVGTHGEISGRFEDDQFTIRHIDLESVSGYTEEVVDVRHHIDILMAEGGHGGGDNALVQDFVKLLNGHEPSISATTIEDSIYGHLAVFLADEAMEEERIIRFRDRLPENWQN